MSTIHQSWRKNVPGLILAAVTIIAGSWLLYLFGPRPEKAPASAPVLKTDHPQPELDADLLGALFKASTATVASGRVDESPARYLASLEAVYRRRGYRRFEFAADGKKNLEQFGRLSGKSYWRTESPGISAVGAIGEDADPNTDAKDGRKQLYLTSVSPVQGGGSQWTTCRYFTDTAALQALQSRLQSDGDWPGQDPPEVPRAPGLRRLISFNQAIGQRRGAGPSTMAVYQSRTPVESLTEWYTKEMPKAGWTLEPRATAGEQARATLYFTMDHRSCLIWINAGAGGDPASIIIGLRAP
ncbi:MAG TPA: hypothetical protein VJ302_13315 [Blastocatellia bacterium]|nr:hypothetical protein [Blastocatellia bacterium]